MNYLIKLGYKKTSESTYVKYETKKVIDRIYPSKHVDFPNPSNSIVYEIDFKKEIIINEQNGTVEFVFNPVTNDEIEAVANMIKKEKKKCVKKRWRFLNLLSMLAAKKHK